MSGVRLAARISAKSDVSLLGNQFVHLLTTFPHLPWKVEFDTHPSVLDNAPLCHCLPPTSPKQALSRI